MTTRLLAPLLLLALPAAAIASPSPKAEAKQHVAKATAAHKAGKFAEALQELQTAYALDPQPELLYAIGQVHVKLGDCKAAIHDYEEFLATKPAEGPAGAANEAITTCKAQLPPEPPPPAPPPAATPPPAPPPPPPAAATGPGAWYTDTVGDALVGGGAALGVASALFYRSALSSLDRADKATTYDAQKSAVDDAHSKRVYSIVLAAGGAVAITAGILHYMHHGSAAEHVAVTPTNGGGTLTFMGSF